MSKTIVVIGVTGAQGSSVAHTFLNLPGWKVRGLTRNPSSSSSQALSKDGVEILKADLDDKASLVEPFKGATAIFSNTDFFTHIFQAPEGVNALEYARDRETQQGVNIAEAAAKPEVLKTLERFIWSSLCDARKLCKGKWQNLYHFDSKTAVIKTINERFPELAKKMSTLQVGHYVENSLAPPLTPKKLDEGSYLIQRTFPPDTKMPFVVARKDTGPFVKALVVDEPAGKDLVGVSEYMTWPEWTQLLSEKLGIKAVFQQVTPEEFWKGLPEALANELGDSFAFIVEYGYTGGDSKTLEAEQLGTEVKRTSMREYFDDAKGDWSAIL